MNIVVLCGNYPAPGHQALVFVQQLVHEFINQGNNVIVVAPQSVTHAFFHKTKLFPKHSKGQTNMCYEYDIYRPYIISFGNSRFLSSLSFFINKAVIISQLIKLRCDVLYAHFWDNAIPVYKFAKKRKLPLFVACGEGDDALERMVDSMSINKIRELASTINGVISVSSENKRKCLEFQLAREDNIEVFPNCVDTDVFHRMDVSLLKQQLGIKQDDFVISFVGGFIPRKGPDRLAKAIIKLNNPRIKVIFIGKEFAGYKYDFDCPGIIFKGPLEHNSIAKYVNCSDVFVLPTQKEGCSNAIVEALAIGLPVISSDGAFNDDILNDKNSIRVNPDDVDAIADAIKTLMYNEDLRSSMANYSIARHEQYTIQGRAMRILAFMNSRMRQ